MGETNYSEKTKWRVIRGTRDDFAVGFEALRSRLQPEIDLRRDERLKYPQSRSDELIGKIQAAEQPSELLSPDVAYLQQSLEDTKKTIARIKDEAVHEAQLSLTATFRGDRSVTYTGTAEEIFANDELKSAKMLFLSLGRMGASRIEATISRDFGAHVSITSSDEDWMLVTRSKADEMLLRLRPAWWFAASFWACWIYGMALGALATFALEGLGLDAVSSGVWGYLGGFAVALFGRLGLFRGFSFADQTTWLGSVAKWVLGALSVIVISVIGGFILRALGL